MSRNKSDTVIDIKFFDITQIKKDSIIVILGKRNSGKSVLIKHLLKSMEGLSIGTVISETDHVVHFYDQFIPGMFIYPEFSNTILEKVFYRQEKALENKWPNPYAFLLMDDCLSDAKAWASNKKIKEIFYNGRHYKLLFILAMQAPMGLPPAFRTNIDYTFIFKNNNFNDRKKIYENYAGCFESRQQFEAVLDSCTEDYHCLVINNVTRSNKLQDQVSFFKANLHPDFKMCNNTLWHINNTQFNKSNKAPNVDKSVVQTKNNTYIINKKRR